MSEYGAHGDLVEAFLTEVGRQDPAIWQELSSGPLSATQERIDASAALTRIALPDAARAAVVDAAMEAYLALNLDPGDFPGVFRLSSIRGGIETAAVAIAAGDALTGVHRETLLRPFADAGFASAAAALDRVP